MAAHDAGGQAAPLSIGGRILTACAALLVLVLVSLAAMAAQPLIGTSFGARGVTLDARTSLPYEEDDTPSVELRHVLPWEPLERRISLASCRFPAASSAGEDSQEDPPCPIGSVWCDGTTPLDKQGQEWQVSAEADSPSFRAATRLGLWPLPLRTALRPPDQEPQMDDRPSWIDVGTGLDTSPPARELRIDLELPEALALGSPETSETAEVLSALAGLLGRPAQPLPHPLQPQLAALQAAAGRLCADAGRDLRMSAAGVGVDATSTAEAPQRRRRAAAAATGAAALTRIVLRLGAELPANLTLPSMGPTGMAGPGQTQGAQAAGVPPRRAVGEVSVEAVDPALLRSADRLMRQIDPKSAGPEVLLPWLGRFHASHLVATPDQRPLLPASCSAAAGGLALPARFCSPNQPPPASGAGDRSPWSVARDALAWSVPLPVGAEDERYALWTTPAGAPGSVELQVAAPAHWGLLQGLSTARQLLQAAPISKAGASAAEPAWSLRAPAEVSVVDAPRVRWRGLHLDSARHFMPPSAVLRTVAAISMAKMNVLHWHLSDAASLPLSAAQGWGRIRTPLGALTESPQPDQAGVGHYHYSAADIGAVVWTGALRGVRIVPEVDVPAHALAWAARPGADQPGAASASAGDLALGDEMRASVVRCPNMMRNDPGRTTRMKAADLPAMDPTDPKNYLAVSAAIVAVLRHFPDPSVHLGGDEVVDQCWSEDAGLQERAIRLLGHAPGRGELTVVFQRLLWRAVHRRQADRVQTLLETSTDQLTTPEWNALAADLVRVGRRRWPSVWQESFDNSRHRQLQRGGRRRPEPLRRTEAISTRAENSLSGVRGSLAAITLAQLGFGRVDTGALADTLEQVPALRPKDLPRSLPASWRVQPWKCWGTEYQYSTQSALADSSTTAEFAEGDGWVAGLDLAALASADARWGDPAVQWLFGPVANGSLARFDSPAGQASGGPALAGRGLIQSACWYLDWDLTWQQVHGHDSVLDAGSSVPGTAGLALAAAAGPAPNASAWGLTPANPPAGSLPTWDRSVGDGAARLLGGEASMWTEEVTSDTLDCRVWPRAAAAAERLWTPLSALMPRLELQPGRALELARSKPYTGTRNAVATAAQPRLAGFRDRLVRAGVQAAPLDLHQCAKLTQETERFHAREAVTLWADPSATGETAIQEVGATSSGQQEQGGQEAEEQDCKEPALRFVSWNIEEGGKHADPAGLPTAMWWLREVAEADVVVLTEANGFARRRRSLRELRSPSLLRRLGDSVQGDWPEKLVAAAKTGGFAFAEVLRAASGYHIAVLSRLPLRVLARRGTHDRDDGYMASWPAGLEMERGAIAVEARRGCRRLVVVGTHLDAHSHSHRLEEAKGLAALAAAISADMPGVPLVMAGDFNSLLEADGDCYEGFVDFVLSHGSATQRYKEKYLQADPSSASGYRIAYAPLRALTSTLAEMGAAGLSCEDRATEPTLSSPLQSMPPASLPFVRVDYVLGNAAAAAQFERSCRVAGRGSEGAALTQRMRSGGDVADPAATAAFGRPWAADASWFVRPEQGFRSGAGINLLAGSASDRKDGLPAAVVELVNRVEETGCHALGRPWEAAVLHDRDACAPLLRHLARLREWSALGMSDHAPVVCDFRPAAAQA